MNPGSSYMEIAAERLLAALTSATAPWVFLEAEAPVWRLRGFGVCFRDGRFGALLGFTV